MYYVSPLVWFLTIVWFFGLLFGDLYLSRKHQDAINTKVAVIRSVIWVSLGLLFGLFIWLLLGAKASGEYYTGFIIEKSLSVDNILVWSAIFAYLKIPRNLQYTVLFWGIIGAIFFRTIFVFSGIVILDKFSFMLLFLGVLLIYSAYGIFKNDEDSSFDPEKSRIIKLVKKILPFTTEIYGRKLFVKIDGKKIATYLFFAICIIELSDILFAIDSVPTVLAVVRDPYIALTSNIAALLGLRALYFVFDNIKNSFWLLNKGLSIILASIGISLLLEPESIFGYEWFGVKVPVVITLMFIFIVLTISVVSSLVIKNPSEKTA